MTVRPFSVDARLSWCAHACVLLFRVLTYSKFASRRGIEASFRATWYHKLFLALLLSYCCIRSIHAVNCCAANWVLCQFFLTVRRNITSPTELVITILLF
jgi:hypothetical protein